MKTEHAKAADVFWQGIAGVWHLCPVAEPILHIPQLCPSLPAGPPWMLTFRDQVLFQAAA